jgi:hypothetical protein
MHQVTLLSSDGRKCVIDFDELKLDDGTKARDYSEPADLYRKLQKMKVPEIEIGMGTYRARPSSCRNCDAATGAQATARREFRGMTLFLEELWRQRPLNEQIPPRALAEDKIAWRGDEAAVFGVLFDHARAFVGPARRLRDTYPENPQLEMARVCLAHLSARRNALFESWDPQGPAN